MAEDMNDPREVAARYFTAINDEAWEDIGALFHPDATYSTPGARMRTGRGEIVALYRRLFSGWRTHVDTPVKYVVEGETVVVEISFKGETADGNVVSFGAVDVFVVSEGMILSGSTWFDSLALHRATNPEVSGR